MNFSALHGIELRSRRGENLTTVLRRHDTVLPLIIEKINNFCARKNGVDVHVRAVPRSSPAFVIMDFRYQRRSYHVRSGTVQTWNINWPALLVSLFTQRSKYL